MLETSTKTAPNSSPPTAIVRTPGSVLLGLIRTARPNQLVKNVFVLAPVVFAKEIFDPDLLRRAAGAFITFSMITGAVYTMNDLVDAEADREHPVKRFRPIASGQVPHKVGVAFLVLLIALGIGGAATGALAFLITLCTYFALNVAYSFRLKKVPYLDVGIIATGFVLRVMAGGFGTHVQVSAYLFVCTALLALFLGFGKRRHELAQAMAGGKGKKQRAVLEAYSKLGLDIALGLTATATIVAYVMYTLDSGTRAYFGVDELWVTTIFVLAGVARFLFLVRNRPEAESPTQEMLRDGPFVAIVLLWGAAMLWLVYNLRPGS